MRLDIPNIGEIVRKNSLPQVTCPVLLDKDGNPTSDGLYSYEMFGRLGSDQRRSQFGYVDLKRRFLHPAVHNVLIKVDRSIAKVISGSRWVSVSRVGELQEAKEGEKGAGTGLDFLYDNWERIRFPERDTQSRSEKLDFIKMLGKDEAFVDRWLVIPPHFRDLDASNAKRISTDVLTGLYAKLLNGVSVMGRSSDIQLTGCLSEARVQDILGDLYAYFTVGVSLNNGMLERKGSTGISGKRGIIHQSLLAKNIDYTARLVISCADMCSPTYDTQHIPYGYLGIPLYVVLVVFFPVVQYEMSNYLSDQTGLDVFMEDGKTKTPLTVESIKKVVKMYAGTQEKRLVPVTFYDRASDVRDTTFDGTLGRQYTLTDLMYSVALRAVGGRMPKHVCVTRYPLEDYRNLALAKVRVLVTESTTSATVGAASFREYPLLEGENTKWVDSLRPNSAYLPGWGGDLTT